MYLLKNIWLWQFLNYFVSQYLVVKGKRIPIGMQHFHNLKYLNPFRPKTNEKNKAMVF